MDSITSAKIVSLFDRAKREAIELVEKESPRVTSAAQLLTAKDVAARLQTNTQAVYRLQREGKLPGVKLGQRTLRWTDDVVREFIAQGGIIDQTESKALRLLRASG